MGETSDTREGRAAKAVAPRRVGLATVDVLVTVEGAARIDYTATYTDIPRSGAWLHWTGVGLRVVECTLSTGDPPVVRVAGHQVTLVVPSGDPTSQVIVRLRYTLSPSRFGPHDDGLFIITAENLPTLERAHFERMVPPGSALFDRDPDVVVRVCAEAAGQGFVGPKYVRQPQPSSVGEHVFSLYEGLTPFRLVFGRGLDHDSRGDVTVLRPVGPTGTGSAGLLGEIDKCSRMVRRYFADLFGNAAVRHEAIVVLFASDYSSSCDGSAILLNAADLGLIRDPKARRASLVDALAHEYAHAWWSYSVLWEDRRTHDLVNEMLAILLARDCVAALGAGVAGDPHSELWAYAAYAVRQRESDLLTNVSTSSGSYAATMLIDLTRNRRADVLAALQQLWNDGHTAALTRRRLHEVLVAHLGVLAAQAVTEALEHPKPAVVAARIDVTTRNEWRVILHPSLRAGPSLRRRLTAAGYPQRKNGDSQAVTVSAPSKSELVGRLYSLQPLHVMFCRSVRLLSIHSRPWPAGMWRWASCGEGSLLRCGLALILNSEDPAGWQGLSRFFAAFWPWMSRRFAIAAGRRAVYAGEDHIRAQLEVGLKSV